MACACVILGMTRETIFGCAFKLIVDVALVTSQSLVFAVELEECVVVEFCRHPSNRCVTTIAAPWRVGCETVLGLCGLFVVFFVASVAVSWCAAVHVVYVAACAVHSLVLTDERIECVMICELRRPPGCLAAVALFASVWVSRQLVYGLLAVVVVLFVAAITRLANNTKVTRVFALCIVATFTRDITSVLADKLEICMDC